MPAEDVNIAKSGQFRIFVQADGSSPLNPYLYVGCLSLGGFQEDLGTGEPIYCPSSEVAGAFDIVDTTSPPPAIPTTDFTQHMNRLLNDFWWDLRRRKCEFNMKIKGSNCARPDDPDDFQGQIIARRNKMTAFNTGAFNGLAEDAAIDLTGTIQTLGFDRFVPVTFGEVADSDVFSEVRDGIYADKIQCGDCGSPSDGCKKMYALTTTIAASPSLPAQLAYSLDGGSTWAYDSIDSLGTQTADALAQIGTRIVVVSEIDESHQYKNQSSIDAGVSGGWTAVTGGYVAGHGPTKIWSKSPSETYVAAEDGYVYFMSNPAAAVRVLTDGSVTAQDLNDIRGRGQTIVSVGDLNAVIVSYNGGATWALVVGPAVGVNLNTVEIINDRIWFVGCANGKSYFTTDGGSTWVENTPDALITSVTSIRFVDDIVGWMTATLSGGVRVYRTADNGYSWHFDGSYVGGVPVADHLNFIAPCPGNYNTVFAGGLASGSVDGIIVLGVG
jgi:photosystem II stability/assembly factor-like uncharacterized protein